MTTNDVFTLLGVHKDANDQESDSHGGSDLNFSDFAIILTINELQCIETRKQVLASVGNIFVRLLN